MLWFLPLGQTTTAVFGRENGDFSNVFQSGLFDDAALASWDHAGASFSLASEINPSKKRRRNNGGLQVRTK